MPQANLTNRLLSTLVSTGKPYYIRDTTLRGFGIKVSARGQIKFIVEVWTGKTSTRKTIGEYPYMPIQEAKVEALTVISDIMSFSVEI